MRRILDLLSVPFLIFLTVAGIAMTIAFLIVGTEIVAAVLKTASTFIVFELWATIGGIFSDPWKAFALPISAGAVIVLCRLILNGSESDGQTPVMRGRQLGESRGRQNQSRPSDAGRKTPAARTPPSGGTKKQQRPGR